MNDIALKTYLIDEININGTKINSLKLFSQVAKDSIVFPIQKRCVNKNTGK